MTEIREVLQADLKTALKARDSTKVTTLRAVIGAVQLAEKGGKTPVVFDSEAIIGAIRKQVKQRHEAAEAFNQVGASERAAQELHEASILEVYLPKQLDEAEVQVIVDSVIAGFENPTQKDFGSIMKLVLAQTGGRADGKTVSALVKASF